MRAKSICLGAVLVLLAPLSAAQPSALPNMLAQAEVGGPSCCQQLAKLERTPLPTKLSEIVLNETFPTFDFGDGPQVYLLIELPKYSKPYHINITNVPQAPGIFNTTDFSQIPLRIKTFDSAFQQKRSYHHVDMKKRGTGFEKTVFINPTNSTETFILIYGDQKAAGEENTISEKGLSTSGMVGGISAALFVAAITGGAYTLANPVLADGTDRKIFIKPNDKGIIVLEPKGLPPD